MKKTIIIVIAVAIVVGAGAFWGGMKYGQGKSLTPQSFQNLTQQQRQQLFANAGGARTGSRNGTGGGFSGGQIIAKDDKSITVKALPEIIEKLQAQGYRFVTVPELLDMPAYND